MMIKEKYFLKLGLTANYDTFAVCVFYEDALEIISFASE